MLKNSVFVLLFGVLSCSCVLAGQKADGEIAARAFYLRMNGSLSDAIDLLEDSDDPAAQFELARCYMVNMKVQCKNDALTTEQKKKTIKQQIDLAHKAISKAIKADASNRRYYYQAGIIDTFRAVYDAHSVWTIAGLPAGSISSINNYKKAVRLDPDFHKARQNLMGLYDRLPWYCGGSKDDAEKQLKILMEKDVVYGARAQCEIRPRKKPEQKVEIWKKAVEQLPDDPAVHYELACAYINAKQNEDARIHINKAIELDVSADTMLLAYADACRRVNEFQKARQLIEQYLNSEPDPSRLHKAKAYRILAKVMKQQGDPEKEHVLRDLAGELDPYDIMSQNRIDADDLFTAP